MMLFIGELSKSSCIEVYRVEKLNVFNRMNLIEVVLQSLPSKLVIIVSFLSQSIVYDVV